MQGNPSRGIAGSTAPPRDAPLGVSGWDGARRRPVTWLLSFAEATTPLACSSRTGRLPTRCPVRAVSLLCSAAGALIGAHLQAQGTAATRSLACSPSTHPHHHPPSLTPARLSSPVPFRPERCGRHFNQPCRNSYLPSPGLHAACLFHWLRLCIIRVFVEPQAARSPALAQPQLSFAALAASPPLAP